MESGEWRVELQPACLCLVITSPRNFAVVDVHIFPGGIYIRLSCKYVCTSSDQNEGEPTS